MRNTVAKKLRKAALNAPRSTPAAPYELVWGTNSVINEPSTIHALYLRLKHYWKEVVYGSQCPVPVATRQRKSTAHYLPVIRDRAVAMIKSPLKQLKALFPPVKIPNGSTEVHHIVGLANWHAARGDGQSLQRLARAYL